MIISIIPIYIRYSNFTIGLWRTITLIYNEKTRKKIFRRIIATQKIKLTHIRSSRLVHSV